jgi:hypothetical protein
MPAEETRLILEAELGLRLANIFEWIDLRRPLGSASISQARRSSACQAWKLTSAPCTEEGAQRLWLACWVAMHSIWHAGCAHLCLRTAVFSRNNAVSPMCAASMADSEGKAQ